MKSRNLILALSGVFLLFASAGAQTYTEIYWYLTDGEYKVHDVVDVNSPPDLNGDCVAQYTSEPQYDANVELDADVSLTAGGGLVMRGWAVQGNEAYHLTYLRLTAIEEFAATASGALPPNLALRVNLEINGSVFVSEKHTGLCGPGYTRSNWIVFRILIMDSDYHIVAEWVSPVDDGVPRLTLAADTDVDCLNPNYWVIDYIFPTPSTVNAYDNGCGVDICPDEDLNYIDYHVPFNGAYVDVSVAPTLTLPDFQPGETYRFIIHARDVMHGMGALDFWSTIEFGETPFVFGTLSDGTFTPLPPKDQAKLTLKSVTGAMRKPNVAVDVKPGSRPNPINTTSKGVTTVAILGSDHLDVTQIDPASIRLEGKEGLRWSIEDVAAPSDGSYAGGDCEASDPSGPDGFDDLVVKFDTQEIVETLTDMEDGACTRLWLTGNLQEEYGGQAIQGYDMARIER